MVVLSVLAYGPDIVTKQQLAEAMRLGIRVPQGLQTQDGATVLPPTPVGSFSRPLQSRPLQSTIDLQRQSTFWGIHAGTSSRKCNEATFISITTRAGEYDDVFKAESRKIKKLIATQATLRKKPRESLTAQEQATLAMPCVQRSPEITLRFGGAALLKLHDQRFEGLELEDRFTDYAYESAAQFQTVYSDLSCQIPIRGEIDIEKRSGANEVMAQLFQQWLPQEKRSLFLSPTHITSSSLKVSPHKADLNIVDMNTMSSPAASNATSALTSLSASDDGKDVEMVGSDDESPQGSHATDSSSLSGSDEVSEYMSSSYMSSGSSEAESSAPSLHWLDVVSAPGNKRNVRMNGCLDYKALRNTPIEEGKAFGAFLEDLHKEREEPLRFYVEFDGKTYKPHWTLPTGGKFDSILVKCCQIIGYTCASDASDAILTDLEHDISFVRSPKDRMVYRVSGFNSSNYPLLPLHEVLLSAGLSPASAEGSRVDPGLVQIYEGDILMN